MHANNPIMAYIEISVGWNMDLIALKGENAVGQHFFVPMQTDNESSDDRYYRMRQRPYPSFNIVATQDNTKIKIKVPRAIWAINGEPSATNNGYKLEAGEHILWLNKGESSIICPWEEVGSGWYDNRARAHGYRTSLARGIRLEGSEVTVMTDEGSGGGIVVLTRDDIVIGNTSGNPDYVSDQLVPVPLLGTDYGIACLQTTGSRENPNEFIYVVGTEDNTKVDIYRGTSSSTLTVNRGQQLSVNVRVLADAGIYIHSDKKVGIFHMSRAFEDGNQMGGAVIPALPAANANMCIGSKSVAFSRTKAYKYIFYLTLLAWVDETNPVNSSVGHFSLEESTLSGYKPVTSSGLKAIEKKLNELSNWKKFNAPAGSAASHWRYMILNTDSPTTNVFSADPEKSYRITNNGNVFHLGVMNGWGGTDFFYGYFSDFKQIEVNVSVNLTDLNGKPISANQGAATAICLGTSVKLGTGGDQNKYYHYTWSPSTYLDPSKLHEATQTVTNPRQDITYHVQVEGFCNLRVDREVSLKVAEPPTPVLFVPGRVCGPSDGSGRTTPVALTVGSLRHATKLQWSWKRWDEAVYRELGAGGAQQLDPAPEDDGQRYARTLELPASVDPGGTTYDVRVSALNSACEVAREGSVTIYPGVGAPVLGPLGASSCGPRVETLAVTPGAVSYTHLTLPTTPYV